MSHRSPVPNKRKSPSRPQSPQTGSVQRPSGRATALEFVTPQRRPKHAYSHSFSSGLALVDHHFNGKETSGRAQPRVLTAVRRSSPGAVDRALQSALRHQRANSYSEPRRRNKEKEDFAGKRNPIVTVVAHMSQVGFVPNNPAKVNQDAYIVANNLSGINDVYLFAVADGHGIHGHHVSSFIKQRLPTLLSQEPSLLSRPKKALNAAVVRCNAELATLHVDISLSGSTLTAALVGKDRVWCANVGDSRTLLARNSSPANSPVPSAHWVAISLSRDHKPEDMSEAARVLSAGGRIAAYQDEKGQALGPARVWLKNQQLPGLAMTRALGDTVAATVGVTCIPEITDFALTKEDKFLVCGSDGVFEFLSNEEVVRLIVPFYQQQNAPGACDCVVREARKRWTDCEEVVDDITCLVVFLSI